MTEPALLIVGHGTRSAAGVEQFLALVDRVRARAGGIAVGGGFIELSAPALTESVGGLVGAGHRRFGVVPLVLVAAGHAKGDIPGALARERSRHAGLTFAYGRPLGPHPTLLDTLDRRVEESLAAAPGPVGRADTAVLLVGRGSTDPDANAEVAKVARLLWEGRDLAFVETAFISLARPGVAEGLERVRRLGARRVVVLPYFLFEGVLPDRVVRQARDWAAAHPQIDVRTAGLLGDTDGLADLVLERYEEALVGDVRMNCDSCVYRIAMPGFEDRVGAPQTPHDHPDDPALGPGHPHGHDHPHIHDQPHGHAHDQPARVP